MRPSCQRRCGTGTELFGGKRVSQQAAEDDHLRASRPAIDAQRAAQLVRDVRVEGGWPRDNSINHDRHHVVDTSHKIVAGFDNVGTLKKWQQLDGDMREIGRPRRRESPY